MARPIATTSKAKEPTEAAKAKARALAKGYASGLEDRVHGELKAQGIDVPYEAFKVYYTPPLKTRQYTPDFVLPNGIVVETKGRFDTNDRQKHKAIKVEHPDLDVRFVFGSMDRNNKPRPGSQAKLTKGSPTTYAAWCSQYGFQYADISVPVEWIEEPRNETRIKALEAAGIKPAKK